MRSFRPHRAGIGFVLRDVLVCSLIVCVTLVFVDAHLRVNQAIWRGALCQGNARQVGMALFMYAEDFDGKLPAVAGSFNGIFNSTRPYLRDTSRYYCPALGGTSGSIKLGFRTPALYAGKSIAGGWPDPYLNGRPAAPWQTILMYESDTDQGTAIQPSYRHNGGAVLLMFTGQAAQQQKLSRDPSANR